MVSPSLERSHQDGEPTATTRSNCFGDAVGELFDAAGLPQRFAYGARAWCLRRGGDLALVAGGGDPKALALALLSPISDPEKGTILLTLPRERLLQEMSADLGLKLVEELRLRQALQAAAAAEGTAGAASAGGAVAPVKALATPSSNAMMSKKRSFGDMEEEEEVVRVCKSMKRTDSNAQDQSPSLAVMAAMAA